MNLEQARFNMIEQQIRTWEVLDQSVLSLLAIVKREDFVPPAHRALAFVDTEIPLPGGQCMLSPKVEARLLQNLAVQRHEQVLEIGAGSGHMAALLAHKGQQVTTLEILPGLAAMAGENLRRARVTNARVIAGRRLARPSGRGAVRRDPVVGLGGERPQPLLEQLKIGGRLAAIVGFEPIMRATLVTRVGEREFRSRDLFDTVAPRLVGFHEPTSFSF